MFFYILKSFQYIINKIEFKEIFWLNLDDLFFEELSYLEKNNIIKQDEFKVTYIWKRELIWYYWLTFLDLKFLIYILKNNFHNKNNISLVK